MRATVLVFLLCSWASAAWAQEPPPILDVHLHAGTLSGWSDTVPVAICAPFHEWQTWDPARHSYEDFFSEVYLQGRACEEPLWSPETDEEVRRRTIEVMERRNIYGVLSSAPDHVEAWRRAAPERFIPALSFSLGADDVISPDSIRHLILDGKVEVFGEIENAYDGIAPDDPPMAGGFCDPSFSRRRVETRMGASFLSYPSAAAGRNDVPWKWLSTPWSRISCSTPELSVTEVSVDSGASHQCTAGNGGSSGWSAGAIRASEKSLCRNLFCEDSVRNGRIGSATTTPVDQKPLKVLRA